MSEQNNSKIEGTSEVPRGLSNTKTPEDSLQAQKAKPIKDKINKLEKIMKHERKNNTFSADDPEATANKLRQRAIDVILRNPGTEEWNKFMELFGFTDDELAQLVPSTNRDTAKDEAIAYLIGGGVCGGSSLDGDGPGIFARVDDTIDD